MLKTLLVERLSHGTTVAVLIATWLATFLAAGWLPPESTIVEVRIWSERPGVAQLFLDAGHGYSEQLSVLAAVSEGDNELTFSVPGGEYYAARLDPINNDGRFEIVSIRTDDGATGSGARIPLETLRPAFGIAEFDASDGRVVGIPVAGAVDPQLNFTTFPFERLVGARSIAKRASYALFLVVALVVVAGIARTISWRALASLGAFGVLVLISRMALSSTTDVSVHPDEFSHLQAYTYYVSRWIPPAVDAPEIVSSFSVYGASYLQELDVVYWLTARVTSVVAPFLTDPLLTARLFNVALWIGLAFAAARKDAWGAAIAVALFSPQIWYVFSYYNADAFPLAVALICATQVADNEGGLKRYLNCEAGFGPAVWVFVVCIALLLVSKRNFLPLIPGFFGWLAVRYLGVGWVALSGGLAGALLVTVATFLPGVRDAGLWRLPALALGVFAISIAVVVTGRSWWIDPSRRVKAIRLAVLTGLAVVLAAPRFALDIAEHGMPSEKAQRVLAMREQHAAPEFKPSAFGSDRAYFGIALAQRGVTLREVLFEPYHWAATSATSAFGVYGYMSIFAPRWTYVLEWLLFAGIAAVGASSVLRDGAGGGKLVTLTAGISLLIVVISLLHSWVDDLQAQGRYLLPIFVMVALMLGSSVRRLGAPAKALTSSAALVSAGSYWAVALATLAASQ